MPAPKPSSAPLPCDGVEHTREFLDSLTDMERSFAEKMRAEEEHIGHHETDKRADIEAIKSFYDDLHHRMELFFTTLYGSGDSSPIQLSRSFVSPACASRRALSSVSFTAAAAASFRRFT